jgi:valyl-tRNA synthetase
MSFDKKYDPKLREAEIKIFWEKNNVFKFDENSPKVVFSIDTPPPTISGRMHIGHAFSYAQTDFIARYKRMKGFEVFYPFGTDDNGLATEKLVEKNKKVNLRRVSREEAVKITMEFLEEEREDFITDFKNIGLSCDFDISYSSINLKSQRVSQESFLDLYERGLIEEREGPVPWDRVFQTPIAQAELEDKVLKSNLNYIKAKILGSEKTYLIYATTRPELLFGCVGINVEDKGEYVKLKIEDEYYITGAKTYSEKFKDFEYEVLEHLSGQDIIGKKVIIPISNIKVEITHDISVKADYGTGVVYYCTYGGMDCIEWMARRPNIKPIKILDKEGRLNSLSKKYSGLIASTQGREQIIKDLKNQGYLIFQEELEHVVNVGERSGVEVEYIVEKQWYVKYLDKKEYFWEMAQKFNWKPEFMKHRLENWIEGLNWDWGFSRQRHFGIPIPVWHCRDCGKHILPKRENLPINPLKDKIESCPYCSSKNIEGEKDVFDTWFTSASTPFLAIDLIKNKDMKDKLFPMDLRPQAHDIINFWLFYTMAKTNLIHRKNPFKNVAISGWVLDPKGKKMSKSKGNTISPQEIVEKYSNDGIRFAAASTKLGQDIPFQEKEVQTGIKVVNKLFNASKFASMLLEGFSKEDKFFKFNQINGIDKWIISKSFRSIKKIDENFNNYDCAGARNKLELLFMNDLADNYIEIVKQRLWKPEEFGIEETRKAQKTLYFVLYSIIRSFAPILPYITEEIYQKFYRKFEESKSIHLTKWPEFNEDLFDENLIELGDYFVSIIAAIRKYKSENKLSMKEKISEIVIECDNNLEVFIKENLKDLKSVTGAESISFGKGNIQIGNNIKIKIK